MRKRIRVWSERDQVEKKTEINDSERKKLEIVYNAMLI